jgi:hypothetical protein
MSIPPQGKKDVGTSNGCLFLFDRCDPSPCFLAAEKILFAPALSLFPSI